LEDRLLDLYRHLRAHFHYAPEWWPGSAWEVFVTALLVQQCDWAVAWAGMQRLQAAGLDTPEALAAAEPEAMSELIRPVSFGPTKAARLREIGQTIAGRYGSLGAFLSPERDTTAVRRELLALPGLGPETTDCILLYASTHPRFVIDAFTRRVGARVGGWAGLTAETWQTARYERLQELLQEALLARLSVYAEMGFDGPVPLDVAVFRDFHAQFVELARHHCTRQSPRCRSGGAEGWRDYPHCRTHCRAAGCSQCPLWEVCAFGQAG
jgi:endonuclease-3 related protein